MTTDWIKTTDAKPKQSGYYMTVQRDTVSGKPFRGMTNFVKGYGWSTLHATVTHWADFPELPEDDNDNLD